MIIINFKTYHKATGKAAEELNQKIENARKRTDKEIIVSPSAPDLTRIESDNLFAQHIDPVNPGSHTGHITIEAAKEAGATGTLLNHSEKRLDNEKLKESVAMAKEKGLTTVVCAQDPEECGEYAELEPDYIAYEPPELIGGNISVSSSKPELIEEAVEKSGEIPVLTGAGIKDREDVKKSIELGCEGILVASGVIKSEDSYEAVLDLCEGL
ncbi:MAG: triosephosphate isomerase [Candidatus Nanohaloarchaea archaeon]|jgi:triosephosphate isomerase